MDALAWALIFIYAAETEFHGVRFRADKREGGVEEGEAIAVWESERTLLSTCNRAFLNSLCI